MSAAAATDTLLEVERLTMRFGGLIAINDVSFSARSRQITGVIGPNGAGKTTLFNCITGFYKPTVGRLLLRGAGGMPFMLERMDGFRIGQKAKVARTFQNIELFEQASVLQNMLVGRYTHRRSNFLTELLFTPFVRREEHRHREAVEKAARGAP